MKISVIIAVYLIAVNIVGGILFCIDKRRALKQKQRIPEKVLHFFELTGAVFVIIPLMYKIRHKNKKAKYYSITYLILIIWLCAIAYCLMTKTTDITYNIIYENNHSHHHASFAQRSAAPDNAADHMLFATTERANAGSPLQKG